MTEEGSELEEKLKLIYKQKEKKYIGKGIIISCIIN